MKEYKKHLIKEIFNDCYRSARKRMAMEYPYPRFINYMCLNAGADFYGHPIMFLKYDIKSCTMIGFKPKFIEIPIGWRP